MDRVKDVRRDGRMEGWIYIGMDRWMYERMEGSGWMDV